MEIIVNGERRGVPDGLTVAGLLEVLQMRANRVAIERNREILPRAKWQSTHVQPNDSFEIVQLVGGGCGGLFVKILTCFVVLLAAVAVPCKATDVRAQYVGKSGCAAEFKTSINDYGVRLDKSKRARLEAHTFKAQTLLTIVQYRSNSDRCGVVRDVIAADRPDNSFVWECFDKTAPEDVVVGTWPGEYSRTSGPALQAWRIDLKKLKFVRLKGAVTCTAGNYAGSDRGEDLATWAHTRSQRP